MNHEAETHILVAWYSDSKQFFKSTVSHISDFLQGYLMLIFETIYYYSRYALTSTMKQRLIGEGNNVLWTHKFGINWGGPSLHVPATSIARKHKALPTANDAEFVHSQSERSEEKTPPVTAGKQSPTSQLSSPYTGQYFEWVISALPWYEGKIKRIT